MKKPLVMLGVLSFAALAHADPTKECIAASEKGQQLRDDHKLLEAREQFLACARDACPPAVKKDCADSVADVDKRTPSVVVHAKDKSGADLVTVHVTDGGKPFTDQLNGQAVPLNPGVHTFRFEAEGQTPIEQQVVLGEGQKDRDVTVSFGGGGGGGGTGPGPEQPAPKKGAPIGGIVLGVVGLVGMGIGTAFYVSGFNEKSNDEKTCAPAAGGPGCTTGQINDIQTQLVVGDIAFYTGVALLAGGIIWTIVHYTSGGSHKEASTASVSFVPMPHGATAAASFSF